MVILMVKNEEDSFSLPYDVDFKVVEKILEFAQMERQGTTTTELFKKVNVKHAS